MARIRTIKPDFFRHEDLQDLEKANPGAYVMLVFAGLWTQSDKDGRFEWKPRTLKLDLLPFLEFDMGNTLDLLAAGRFIQRYEVAGKVYGVVLSWEKHQRITGKEAQDGGKYPEPLREITGEQQENREGNNGETTGKHPDAQEMERNKEKNNPPLTPPGRGGESSDDKSGKSDSKRERKPRIALKTFIEACKQAGEKPISEYRPLLEYVEDTGLPMEFVQLAWEVFKGEFLAPGAKASRLQADWRRHFLNYVTKGYYRLWYARTAEGGATEYVLSTQGVQAEAAVSARRRRDEQE